jgi:hypothetical protein
MPYLACGGCGPLEWERTAWRPCNAVLINSNVFLKRCSVLVPNWYYWSQPFYKFWIYSLIQPLQVKFCFLWHFFSNFYARSIRRQITKHNSDFFSRGFWFFNLITNPLLLMLPHFTVANKISENGTVLPNAVVGFIHYSEMLATPNTLLTVWPRHRITLPPSKMLQERLPTSIINLHPPFNKIQNIVIY